MENPDHQDNQPGDNSLSETNFQLALLRLRELEAASHTVKAAVEGLRSAVEGLRSAVEGQLTAIHNLTEVFTTAATGFNLHSQVQDALARRVQALENDVAELKKKAS